jgi:enterochelin esterase family protein
MSELHPFLSQAGAMSADELDALIAASQFPLVDSDGVTFVYRGTADAVRLRHWIYGLPTAESLEALGTHDLWFLRLDLPRGSRIEYKFEVVIGAASHWIVDPLNESVAEDPFGANSVCRAYGYARPQWTLESPHARRGTIEQLSLHSEALGASKDVNVYIPARFRRQRRYALLIAHDGSDYLRFSGLQQVLDNLIHLLEIPPLIVALSDPGERLVEYAANEQHARHIVEELYPALRRAFPLREEPASRGLLGASFGAVAALHTAWRYPGFFNRLLLQSGSFAFTDIGTHNRGPLFDPVVDFVNRLRQRPGCPARKMFVSCGIYESLIYENRSLVPLLQSAGPEVRFEEARDGHNWENWRDRLRAGLSWLFPGPLWMVYE